MRRYTVFSIVALTTLSACVESTPRLPTVTTASAFKMFEQKCVDRGFNETRQLAAFRNDSNFGQNGDPVTFGGKSSYSFQHTTYDMSGDVGGLISEHSCSITFRPTNGTRDGFVNAGLLMLAKTGSSPTGLDGQGIVSFKYKNGRLGVFQGASDASLTLSMNIL